MESPKSRAWLAPVVAVRAGVHKGVLWCENRVPGPVSWGEVPPTLVQLRAGGRVDPDMWFGKALEHGSVAPAWLSTES